MKTLTDLKLTAHESGVMCVEKMERALKVGGEVGVIIPRQGGGTEGGGEGPDTRPTD